ncbi:hypothetical protein CFD26_103818 [Aspergillus turcosus]|uniref:Plastocyanin-like domain-containing protein n=1 Tax=Aspergillus turcosus TaxID=1245748 RepID=A0A3R7GEC1_9EURO|nr:hypothetical protein CFD26_103818 [Aspergillus turcosus]
MKPALGPAEKKKEDAGEDNVETDDDDVGKTWAVALPRLFCWTTRYCLRSIPAGGASLDLRPVPDANKDTAIGHTGDHSAWNLTAPDVEDGEDDESMLLHPERHVFRDPTTIHMTWNVTLEPRAPDGVMKLVYLINGRFPGPTIEARSGDELVIDVYNSVAEEGGISIHWHGLSMKGANEMDGVVGVTQCAIGPSESYTYRYHAHSGVQRADGLYGGLVVHEPAKTASQNLSVYQQQPQHLLLIGDWYHRQAEAVLEWYRDPGHFGYEPAPDSLLINGKGSYDCSMAVKAHPVECRLIERPVVTFAESNTGFSFSLGQAPMTVIAVDGGNPVAPDTPRATLIGYLNFHLTNFALTPKQSFPVRWRGNSEEVQEDDHQGDNHEPITPFNLAQLSGSLVPADVVKEPTDRSVVYTSMAIRSASGLRPVGSVNRTAWVVADPRAPPLLALNRGEWERVTKQPGPVWTLDVPQYQSGENRWMELVVNNPDNQGHVFHLRHEQFKTPHLVIYNCGPIAGASRNHKHVQILPRPAHLFPDDPNFDPEVIPFQYVLRCLRDLDFETPDCPSTLSEAYQELLGESKESLKSPGTNNEGYFQHNVALVREWMIVIPRRSNNLRTSRPMQPE